MNAKECRELASKSLNRIRFQNIFCSNATAKILISGASGFVGRNLLFVLSEISKNIKLNIEISALVRPSQKNSIKRLYPEVKVMDCNQLHHSIETLNFNHIFHLANSNSDFSSNNLSPNDTQAFKLLEALLTKSSRKEKTRILLASSGAVYGFRNLEQGKPFKETDKIDVSDLGLYAKTKFLCEQRLMESLSATISPIVCRLFSFYGPHLPTNLNYAAGNFYRNVKENERIQIKGSGASLRSYLSSYDLATALIIAISSDLEDVVNIGGARTISILEFASMFTMSSSEKSSATEVCNEGDQPETFYVPDVTLLKQKLRFEESIALADGVNLWLKC